MRWGHWAGMGKASELPALLPRLRDPEPSLPSLPAPESCARWDGWGGARGYPALASHPALQKGSGFPSPSLEVLGAGRRGAVLPSAAQSPGAPVGMGGSAPPASRSELITLLVRPGSQSHPDAPAALFPTRGGGGQRPGRGARRQAGPPAGGLARGPVLGVETGQAVLVSVGGGPRGGVPGASLRSGVQEAVTGV